MPLPCSNDDRATRLVASPVRDTWHKHRLCHKAWSWKTAKSLIVRGFYLFGGGEYSAGAGAYSSSRHHGGCLVH